MRSIKISKSCFLLLFLLIIYLFFFVKTAEAAKIKLRVTVQTANVRLNPDVNSAVIGKAPMGTILESEGKKDGWYKVNLPPNDRGFVISGYIQGDKVEVIEGMDLVQEKKKVKEVRPPRVERIREEPMVDVASSGRPMGKTAFLVNPLGFLQFGPVFSGEFSIASNTFFTAHLRYQALGILYQILARDEIDDYVSFGSMAVGVGMKHFLENPRSPNRFYFGGFAEYGWGGSGGDVDTLWEWKGRNAQINVALNFGHRWRYRSKFLLNVGVLAGTSIEIKDDWWYIDSPSTILEGDPTIYILGWLEFSLGWEW